MLFQKVSRLQKVDLALKGEPSSNPTIKKAVHDYETIIGSTYGAFTIQVDEFHKSLERSGLMEMLFECALVGRDSIPLRAMFAKEHERFFKPGEGNPKELLDNMVSAFRVTVQELTKDRVLFQLVRSSHKEIIGRIEVLEDAITCSIKCGIERLSNEEESAAFLKLAKGLQQHYREVRIETIRGGARPVDIDRIYIPPKLHFRNSKSYTSRLAELNESIRAQDISRLHGEGTGRYLTVSEKKVEETVRTVRFHEFKSSFRRVVVLGDPGGGKSSICQKICYDLTKNAALVANLGSNSNINPQDERIAVRIVLRRFEQARIGDSQLDFIKFISREYVNFATLDEDTIRRLLVPLFESGKAVFAFDGLDEILDTSKRRDFVELVTSFCDRFLLCPALVTSRLVGYDDAALPDTFEEFVLDKFDDAEVESYLNKFMIAVGEKTKLEAQAQSKRFLQQTESSARDLRRNPLLLGLMAYLFNAKGEVPANRPEIYKDCSTLMFERWDSGRGIEVDIPSDFERSELFSELASKIYINPELAGGVNKDWLLGALKDFFGSLYLDRAKSISAARKVTEFLVGRAWVMSEIGDGVFAFTHQTFLEYYFARYMASSLDSVQELLKDLRPRILRREWDVVAHLALQLKTHTFVRKQDEALEWFCSELSREKRSIKSLLALLSFASRSLEYLNGSEAMVSKLVNAIYDKAMLAAPMANRVFAAVECYHYARGRRDLVETILSKRLSETIVGGDMNAEVAVRALAPQMNEFTRHFRRGLSPQLTEAVRYKAKDAILKGANRDVVMASLGVHWYGEYKSNWLQMYGLDVIASIIGQEDDIGGFAWLALAISEAYGKQFRPPNVECTQLLTVVKDISHLPERFFATPLRKHHHQISPPDEVWGKIFYEHRNDLNLLIGLRILEVLSRKSSRNPRYAGTNAGTTRSKGSQSRYSKLANVADAAGGKELASKLAAIEGAAKNQPENGDVLR